MKKLINTSESWFDFSQRLRDRFSKLTLADVAFEEGMEEDTVGRIQARLGWSRTQVLDMFQNIKLPGTALS